MSASYDFPLIATYSALLLYLVYMLARSATTQRFGSRQLPSVSAFVCVCWSNTARHTHFTDFDIS